MKKVLFTLLSLILFSGVAFSQAYVGDKPEAPPGIESTVIASDFGYDYYTPSFNQVEFYLPEQGDVFYYAPQTTVIVETPTPLSGLEFRWQPLITIHNEISVIRPLIDNSCLPYLEMPIQPETIWCGNGSGGVSF